MHVLAMNVQKLICALLFSQGFQYLKKYFHSSEVFSLVRFFSFISWFYLNPFISWVYWFELIFPPLSLCLFLTLLLIPLKYILISESHSSLLVLNTKQRSFLCRGRIAYSKFLSYIFEKRDPAEKPLQTTYFLIEVESHRFCGIVCLTA